jgi:thiosulfate/3-mercaptopyruvate sulfurtransferase
MRRRDLLLGSLALPLARRGVSAQATPTFGDRWPQEGWFANPGWIVEQQAVDPDLRIIALTPDDEFERGHIPGAAQIDWPDLELVDSADATVERWRERVEGLLTGLGVAPESTVVVYDGGTFYAARLWWVLDQLGHADKRILDGGLSAWTVERTELERGGAEIQLALEPYAGTPNEKALARIDEVIAAVEKGTAVLVDARTPDEFREGRIPGAVNIPFTENAVPDSGGRWKSPSDLRGMYAAHGVTPENLVIPYCSTGVRSANTFFTLRALGYPKVKLFSGSFAEWTSDQSRPIESGAS